MHRLQPKRPTTPRSSALTNALSRSEEQRSATALANALQVFRGGRVAQLCAPLKQADLDLRVLRPERIWFMRRSEAVESSCSKLSFERPNEAQGLAGGHRLGQLPGGLARRLVTWCRRARFWRVLVRSCGYSSEKCAARFLKRIFLHSIGLFHLGLLISSSFVLRSASSPTTQLFLNRGRGGWHAVPGPKCFLFRPASFLYRLLQGSGGYTHRGLTAKSGLFFNVLRAWDLLFFFAAIAVLLGTCPTHMDSAIQRPNVSSHPKTPIHTSNWT